MIKLSKTGKMPGPSWSLQALETCPGAYAPGGGLVDACKGCYATTGRYRMEPVKRPRIENREEWRKDGFVSEFIRLLKPHTYFRWFDSGDVYHPELARKIYDIVLHTVWCQHWIPTRSYKIDRIRVWLERIHSLPNAVVRYSSDSVDGSFPALRAGENGSTIYSDDDQLGSAVPCASQWQGGKCLDCRACWDKAVKVVAYRAHGVKMKKVTENV